MQETWEIRVWSLGTERSPGEGNGNPLQYSYLGNTMDWGTWLQFMGSQKSQTQLSDQTTNPSSRWNILQRNLRLRSQLPKFILPCDSNLGFLNLPSKAFPSYYSASKDNKIILFGIYLCWPWTRFEMTKSQQQLSTWIIKTLTTVMKLFHSRRKWYFKGSYLFQFMFWRSSWLITGENL